MCIVIDADTLSCVFNPENQNHKDFELILKWLLNTRVKSKIVYGGSKYLKELKEPYYMRKWIEIFEKMGKVIVADKENVDFYQKQIEEIIDDPDFDDPHILAIFIETKCKLLCSKDKRMYKFIKDRNLPKEIRPERIRIYTGKRNSDLLCNENIANICKN
ncbi:hypothetical protein ACFLSQ_01110 [Bacteroidota bacterium]